MAKHHDALHLFRSAIPLAAIAQRVGYKTEAEVQDAIREALAEGQQEREALDQDLVALERIDGMYRGLYPKALKGDVRAAETCLRLDAERARLLAAGGPKGGLAAAFEETVAALNLPKVDKSAIATGRTVAQQIDETLEFGTPHERTKALYLVPHLMNVLKALGATPEARDEITKAAKAGGRENPIEQILRERSERTG